MIDLLSEIRQEADNILENEIIKLGAAKTLAQAEKEKEAVLRWQRNPNQKDFEFLYKSLKPVIQMQLNKYTKGSPVPMGTFQGDTMLLFVKALKTYNPLAGAKVSVHVANTMKRLFRKNLTYQNVVRFSGENLIGKMTMYDNGKEKLEDKLGREPTSLELADELGWSLKKVKEMEKKRVKDFYVSDTSMPLVDETAASTRFKDKLNYLYMFEARGTEKLVLEYLFGLGGKPEIKRNKDIALKVGITPNRVSQIKGKYARKLERI